MTDFSAQFGDRDTAGSLLRQAREKKGLDIKEIAHRLNLQQDTLHALEQDDNEKLPSSTYVRGYLRSYAKLVGVDPNLVVQIYDSEREPTEKPPEIIAEVNRRDRIRSKDLPVKAVTYLVTFIFALLLLAWLQSHYVVDKTSAVEDEAGVASEHEKGSPVTAQPAGHVVHYYPAYEPEPATPSGPAQSENPDQQVGRMISTIDLPRERGGDASRDGERSLPAGSTGDRDSISLSLTQESWIEIYDANNERLYMGLAQAGEEINLKGTAPLSLLLGYTPGVKINYNGREIEPEHYSSSGVSRLILGGNQARE